MKAVATFSTKDFKPTDLSPEPALATALPVSVSTMEKRYSGEIQGGFLNNFYRSIRSGEKTGQLHRNGKFRGQREWQRRGF